MGELSVMFSGVVLSNGEANSGDEFTGVEKSKVELFINNTDFDWLNPFRAKVF